MDDRRQMEVLDPSWDSLHARVRLEAIDRADRLAMLTLDASHGQTGQGVSRA
jgi:hypothetical protein